MDKKCKNLKTAYEEEHKLREELRTWAEVNMISLQEKVKELSEDKKKSLEKLELVMAGGGKELDSLRKSLDVEYSAKIERVRSEKAKAEAELGLVAANAKAKNVEIASLIMELILKNVESQVSGPQDQPVIPLAVNPIKKQKPDPELTKLKEENLKLKKDLLAAKASAGPAKNIVDPEVLKERDDLKKILEDQNLRFEQKLAEVNSEKENLKKELSIYSAKISAPLDSDNPETFTLKTQVMMLTKEIAEYRDKVALAEGQTAQVKALQENLARKDAEIDVLTTKPVVNENFSHIEESLRIKESEIEKLNQEIENLREQNNELSKIPPTSLVSKPGDDKEKKDLRSLLKKLQKHNETMKEELERARLGEVNIDEVNFLRTSLEEAKAYINILESEKPIIQKNEENMLIEESPRIEQKSKMKKNEKKPVQKTENKLKIEKEEIKSLNEKNENDIEKNENNLKEKLQKKLQNQPKQKNIELELEKTNKDLQQKILQANQQIEFLQSQLKSSGKPVVEYPTEEISKLNEEIQKANQKIKTLTAELNSRGSEGNSEELMAELALLQQENNALKSKNSGSESLELQANIKKLTEELKSRPTQEEYQKLNDLLKAQEKQLKDTNSSQSQQVKILTDQMAQLETNHSVQLKEFEAKTSASIKEANNSIAKLTQQVSELDKVRINLEKQLQSEMNSKAKTLAELEEVKKVAGEAAALSKQVAELTEQVASLKQKNAAKELELKESLQLRKKLHNQLEDLKGKIRVFCRVRPLSKSEMERGCTSITTVVDEFTIACESKNGVKPYVYDAVFGQNSTQDEVFEDTRRVVQSAIDGFNVCVFAYGQTGSGKTFTMVGTPAYPGVTPRAMEEMFNILNHMPSHYIWQVSCYMVEIYMDVLVDLFLPKDFKGTPPNLTIKKDVKGIVVIPEATINVVKSAREIMNKFEEGNNMRHTGSTKMNETSSRSHLIFGIMIDVTNTESNQRTVGKLSLVDLAGSERVGKTEAGGDRLKEGRAINKSLSALGDVISALSSGESHIPYRNNKLTMLMSDSLGGTAKTLMFVNVSPANYNLEETSNSLTYASRVKLIMNDPSKNIESKEMSILKQEVITLANERDKYKAALEKNRIDLNNLQEIQEKSEDFDDPRYDEA